MRPADQTAYIVACIREGGSMYSADAEAFLAEHDAHQRSEVLAEVAHLFDDRGWAFLDGGIMTAADAAELIRQHAAGQAGKDTRGAAQAPTGESTQLPLQVRIYDSLAAFNAVACWDVLRLAQMRQYLAEHLAGELGPAGRESTTTTPGFFQPGHTYTRRDGTTFRCDAITTHPESGQRLALGWHTDLADWTFLAQQNLGRWLHEYDGGAPPAEPILAVDDPGMTTGELLRTPKSTAYCATPGCGHGDNVHGPFCFAAGCDCADFTRGEVPRG